MKKLLSILILSLFVISQTQALLIPEERAILTLGSNNCENIQEKDIPTILIPGILASWYSEEGYNESNIKRWIPDPITHTYDTLIFTFKNNGYNIKDVFYKDQFTLKLDGSNPKGGFYIFGYDWKKDNKITATMLAQLIGLILRDYETQNNCNIGKVNIVSHSMGGLVARAMLEDMCVNFEYNNNNFQFISFPKKEVNGKIQEFDSYPCQNPYSSKTISKDIKVNKFVTISTPQRGSPIALPIWEKGDIEMIYGFGQGLALKFALGHTITDSTFYKQIHGYEKEIPNGIVTIGQLLPDIKYDNDYNNKNLGYLLKNYPNEPVLTSNTNQKYNIPSKNYSENSFLEELNKKENIEKMFDKVDNKYISYYSNVTGNKDENNIVNFELGNIVQEGVSIGGGYKNIVIDKTYEHNGQDIYDKYQDSIGQDYYLIKNKTRNQSGLGGDGTVPTYNLKLVPNDSSDGKEIINPKFESKLIDCSQNTYTGFGTNTTNEACSHTKMPFVTSVKIVDFLAGTYNANIERKYLVDNFGYTNYLLKYLYKDGKIAGIQNTTNLSIYFDSYYTKKNNDFNGSFSLDLPGGAIEKTKSYAMYEIFSPIDILITDEQGRRIGIDRDTGMIINEIPGAWTSGRAGESGEREFFLIPTKNGEQIDHKIETNSTGDGEYHIVMTGYDDKGNTTNSGVIIAGNAKLGFNENYEVVATSTGSNYIDVNVNLPLTLEVTKEFKTNDDKIDVRYNVKGQGRENVEKIRYKIEQNPPNPLDKGGLAQNGEKSIDGILEIPLKEAGNYELNLELLDKDNKILKTETVKIQKGVVEKEVKTIKNVLNAMFYKNIDLNLYNMGSGVINTNYQFKIDVDQNKQNINIINASGENIKFAIDKDFKYKSDKNNGLKILEVNSNNIIFKEIIPDLEIEKIYTYTFIQNRIEKVEIINNKTPYPPLSSGQDDKQKLNVNYDINGNLKEIASDDNILKFAYDEYTGELKNIKDVYENNIEFNYEKGELLNIKVNNELISQSITDLFRLDYKTLFNLKHKTKLQKLKLKLESEKLDEKKKQKIIKSLEKSKEKYLKLSKLDVTKKEIEYLIEEIKKILENLN